MAVFSYSDNELDKYLPLSSPTLLPTNKFRSLLHRIWTFLIPSFLSREPRPREPEFPTAFLDGLRGYAAFFVFITHAACPLHKNSYMGYGGNDGINDHYFLQLPIIRLLHSGQACVHLFFVISGFSITLKPLKLARRGDHNGVYTSLVSATFRRTARLYLPCIALLVCIVTLIFLGAFDDVNKMVLDWPFGPDAETVPPIKEGFFEQIYHVGSCIFKWADPLNPTTRIGDLPYSLQLWTIPVELKCSFITFVAFLGVAKCRPYIRMIALGALALYFYCRKHADPPLFIGGTIIAELYLQRQDNAQAPEQGSSVSDKPSKAPAEESSSHKFLHGALFSFGLFVVSFPRQGSNKALFYAPFYRVGSLVAGRGKSTFDFYTCIGAVIVVYAVSCSRWLQRFFTTPLARYLGKTSFALYCVHQPLISWFGYRTILVMWKITGRDTFWGYELGWGLAFLFILTMSVWAADVFYRGVDVPSVRFARWLEQKCEGSS